MSDFKKRLYDLEVAPPVQVWDKINIALDEEDLKLGSKLYEAAIEPPAGIWNKIAEEIDEPAAKVVPLPFIKRVRPLLRYAAAAILITALVFAGNLILNTGGEDPITVQGTTTITNPGIPPSTGSTEENSSNNLPDPSTDRVITDNLERNTRSVSSRPVLALAPSTRASHMIYSEYENQPAVLQSNFSLDELENGLQQLNGGVFSFTDDGYATQALNRYVTLIRPDGYVIRMSTKFADMIGCMYSSGVVNDNEDCRQQINQWRTRMAKAPVTPSPDNFMDILSLLNSLQEN